MESPRLIIIGGSNIAFGIDSERIQNEIDIPVVNLGLHAGLGLDFMIQQLKYVVRKSDVVIVVPEYHLSMNGDYKLKKHVSQYFPFANQFFHKNLFEEARLFLEQTRENLKKKFKRQMPPNSFEWRNSVYSRASFNQYGDIIGHLKMKSREIMDPPHINKNWEGIYALNSLSEFIKDKGASIFVSYPPFPESFYFERKNAIDNFEENLKRDLRLKILGNSSDFVFPDSLFFDTVYHLNDDGRRIRTDALIKFIKEN